MDTCDQGNPQFDVLVVVDDNGAVRMQVLDEGQLDKKEELIELPMIWGFIFRKFQDFLISWDKPF